MTILLLLTAIVVIAKSEELAIDDKSKFFAPMCFNFKINAYLYTQNNETIRFMSTKVMQQRIADYFKTQPVQKAWLFGSFARGEETPLSDVDLIVQYDENARISLLKHCAILNDLEDLLDRPVDLVEEGTLLPFTVESANRDKKLIYEKGNG